MRNLKLSEKEQDAMEIILSIADGHCPFFGEPNAWISKYITSIRKKLKELKTEANPK